MPIEGAIHLRSHSSLFLFNQSLEDGLVINESSHAPTIIQTYLQRFCREGGLWVFRTLGLGGGGEGGRTLGLLILLYILNVVDEFKKTWEIQ